MPSYDYHCTSCGFVQEITQRMSEAALTKCPNCGKETFERAITGGAGVLYKGEGWYVTDYSKKSSGGKDKDSSSSATVTPSAVPTAPSTPIAPSPKTESKL